MRQPHAQRRAPQNVAGRQTRQQQPDPGRDGRHAVFCRSSCITLAAIAQVDASTAWCINQNSGCSMTAALLAPDIAREIFGGPRGILAWGPGPGEARVAPGGYRVTATWSFASGSQHASWLGCHVPIVEADGTPRLRADRTPVVRTMLFPKSSTEFCDIWHTIGLRGTASNQYSVKDLV